MLQTKSFDEITVQDITEAATVNRATFYDHYADKFALLDALIAGGFHSLLHQRDVRFEGNCPSEASEIIRAACDYVLQMRECHTECTQQSAFEPLIDAAITAAIRRVLTRNDSPKSRLSPMTASAASWAINGAVKGWYNTPDRLSVDEVVPQILAMILPMLQSGTAADSTVEQQTDYALAARYATP
jgi:AcrR family transcriptional regulator